MNLQNQTALITGASSGIGEQFALQLADQGTNLILVARNATKLQALSESIRSAHPEVRVDVVAADLSDARSSPSGG